MAHHLFSSPGSRKALSALLLFTLLFSYASAFSMAVQPVSATADPQDVEYTLYQYASAAVAAGYQSHAFVPQSCINISRTGVFNGATQLNSFYEPWGQAFDEIIRTDAYNLVYPYLDGGTLYLTFAGRTAGYGMVNKYNFTTMALQDSFTTVHDWGDAYQALAQDGYIFVVGTSDGFQKGFIEVLNSTMDSVAYKQFANNVCDYVLMSVYDAVNDRVVFGASMTNSSIGVWAVDPAQADDTDAYYYIPIAANDVDTRAETHVAVYDGKTYALTTITIEASDVIYERLYSSSDLSSWTLEWSTSCSMSLGDYDDGFAKINAKGDILALGIFSSEGTGTTTERIRWYDGTAWNEYDTGLAPVAGEDHPLVQVYNETLIIFERSARFSVTAGGSLKPVVYFFDTSDSSLSTIISLDSYGANDRDMVIDPEGNIYLADIDPAGVNSGGQGRFLKIFAPFGDYYKIWFALPAMEAGDCLALTLRSKASVTANWNGSAVFRFYDDFNDNSYDTEKWTTVSGGGGAVTEQNGELEIKGGGSSRTFARTLISFDASTAPYLLEYKQKISTASGSTAMCVIHWDGVVTGAYDDGQYGYYAPSYNSWDSTKHYGIYELHSAWTWLNKWNYVNDGNWVSVAVVAKTSSTPTIAVSLNNTLRLSTNDNTRHSGYIGFSSRESVTSYNAFFDDVRVRDYMDSPPYAYLDLTGDSGAPDLTSITIGPFTLASSEAFNTTAYSPANGTWDAASGTLIFSPGVADVNITADRFPSTAAWYFIAWWDDPLDLSTADQPIITRVDGDYDLMQIPMYWHSPSSGDGYCVIVRFITLPMMPGMSMNISGDASFNGYTDTDGVLTLTGCGDIVLSSEGLPSGDFFVIVNGAVYDDWAWNGSYIWLYDVPCPDAAITIDFDLPGEHTHCTTCGGGGGGGAGGGGGIPQGDNDGDGAPDNADPDDDNDGLPDAVDPRPFNWDPPTTEPTNETVPPTNQTDTTPTQDDFGSAVDSAFGFIPEEIRPVVVFTIVGLPVIFMLLLIVGGGATAKGAVARTRAPRQSQRTRRCNR